MHLRSATWNGSADSFRSPSVRVGERGASGSIPLVPTADHGSDCFEAALFGHVPTVNLHGWPRSLMHRSLFGNTNSLSNK